MLQQILITLGSGVASAVFFFLPAKGSLLALAVGVFAPLPMLIVALGYGRRSGAIAAAVGAALITAALHKWLALAFVVSVALPSLLIGFAVQKSPAGSLARIFAAIVALTIAVDWISVCLVGWSYDSFDAAVADLTGRILPVVTALFARMETVPGGIDAPAFAHWMVFAIAPAMAVWGVLALSLNLWLAARIVQISGRLPQPWPDIPAGLGLPRICAALLALACALSLAPGAIRIFASTAAAGLAAAMALQGLAILHFRTRGMASRGAMLTAVYGTALVVFPWPLVLLSSLGFADLIRPLRFAGPSQTPTPKTPKGEENGSHSA